MKITDSLDHKERKKAFPPNVNRPFSSQSHMSQGHGEVQVEHVWTCLGSRAEAEGLMWPVTDMDNGQMGTPLANRQTDRQIHTTKNIIFP